jgi:hypothetical protein
MIAVAILATLLEPAKMRSSNPAPAIRRAAQLLDRVPESLPFKDLDAAQEGRLLHKKAAANRRLVRLWKMDKGPWFTPQEFLGTPGCKHKSVNQLEAMLKRAEFPFLETGYPPLRIYGRITLKAYQRALKRVSKLRRKRKLENQEKRRAKQV